MTAEAGANLIKIGRASVESNTVCAVATI